jgi:zinc protease
MRMEADRMANLVLTDAVVLPERDVILEERRQVVDNVPSARLREQVLAAMFLNHPYGRPIIGWEHEIRSLTRADAEAWYAKWYAPNNAVLIVAGDVDAAELRPLAEKHYGPIARRDVPTRVRPAEPPPQAPRRVTLRDERVRQPSWSRTWLAPSLGPGGGDAAERRHAYPLQIAADVIGAQSGRLYRALVLDRKVAVSAGAGYDTDSHDRTTFVVTASPQPGVSLDVVERAVDEELAALLRDGVTAEEVERSKQRMAAAAILARDSLATGPRVIGQALMSGIPLAEVEAWPERMAAVDAAMVNEALRATLRDEASVTAQLLPRENP